jgi:hypothetical protein
MAARVSFSESRPLPLARIGGVLILIRRSHASMILGIGCLGVSLAGERYAVAPFPRTRTGTRGRCRISNLGPRRSRRRPPPAKGPVADPVGRTRTLGPGRADPRGPASSRGTRIRGLRLRPVTPLSPIRVACGSMFTSPWSSAWDRFCARGESLWPSIRSGC